MMFHAVVPYALAFATVMGLSNATSSSDLDDGGLRTRVQPIIGYVSVVTEHHDFKSSVKPYVFTETEPREEDVKTYTGSKALQLSLSDQTLLLIESGSVLKSYPVSSGKATTPTPIGRFRIHRKQDLRVSSQEVPYRMPYYMAFTPNGAYGIHALPYLGVSPNSSNYWHEAGSHIGIPVSHGCVRLLPEDASEVYEWMEIGVPVLIHR